MKSINATPLLPLKKTKVMLMLAQLNTGGIQKMAIDLASHLDRNMFDVCILSLKPRNDDIFEKVAAENNIPIIYLHKRAGIDFSVIPEIYHAIKQYKPDIIHANQRTLTYALFPILLRHVNKIIYTVHNLAEQDARGIDRMIIKLANRYLGVTLVAISDICKSSIIDTYHISAEKIPCIYNGVDINYFTPQQEETVKDIDFLAVGRMSPQKNYSLMLRAFKRVHELYPTSKLTILGDGANRSEIENFCKTQNLSAFVDMPGNVANVREYLWKSKIFLMSSDYEGLPVTVLEAMAAGLPIIATRAGGIPDIVENGKNGILVDIGDEDKFVEAMSLCLQSDSTRLYFSQNSRIYAQNYSIDQCTNKYTRLYLGEYT